MTDNFVSYYREQSQSAATLARFESVRQAILRVARERLQRPLRVADVGCGAGTQSMLWAADGDSVCGLDINHDLIELGKQRAKEQGLDIELTVGSAAELPWPDGSFDVCLVPELLEHVVEWSRCLDEVARVVKPGGLLFLSTTNKLCPKQQEFELPLYSWYPGFLKRRCEKLAVTTHREWVCGADYPAVNWFSFFSLRKELAKRGFSALDRFDLLALDERQGASRVAVDMLRRFSPLRWLGHVCTPYTLALGIKESSSDRVKAA